MKLFNFTKKNSISKKEEYTFNTNTNLTIIVLGNCCKKCEKLLENSKEAIKNLKIDANLKYITKMEDIISYKVMVTPALIINNKVIATGKVLSTSDIEKIFKEKFL